MICADYTNLNKVCSKYSYLLFSIYQLVNVTLGHELLIFINIFLGYNQIRMVCFKISPIICRPIPPPAPAPLEGALHSSFERGSKYDILIPPTRECLGFAFIDWVVASLVVDFFSRGLGFFDSCVPSVFCIVLLPYQILFHMSRVFSIHVSRAYLVLHIYHSKFLFT